MSSQEQEYDWGTSKNRKEEGFRRRDSLAILRADQEARREHPRGAASINPTSVSQASVREEVPQRVNLDSSSNQYPGEFRYYRMPDDTIVDVMQSPKNIGKWDQILFYMYKRPIVPISAVGVLGSFASSLTSVITKQPSKTTHFWANATAAFKVIFHPILSKCHNI